ncbi:MAG: NAD(P)/FAD-dependent oxidoreductase [Acidimicrobiia bacterium]|nr:NAD(P)/FAD-dependent oxidoreductase [Acidimicrobiia bacterium]
MRNHHFVTPISDNQVMPEYDAVVVGAGPNGLAAAAHLTRRGRKVLVVERADVIGGGTRTEELTLPGFRHDVCSAIHPLGIASPFFREIGLDVEWVQPRMPVSHPLGGGRPAGLSQDFETTATRFGEDADRYRKIVGPLVARADELIEDFVGPIATIPSNPSSFVRLATRGALPAATIINGFVTGEARAVMAGMAAHAIAPFTSPLTGGVTLLFTATAHAYGWPMVRGGSQEIAEALARIVTEGGGSIETGHHVDSLDDLPEAPVYLLDVMPEAAAAMSGGRVSSRFRSRAPRRKVGPGVFKVDWALGGPIPWLDEMSPLAGTVHLGGRYEDVMAAEDEVHSGSHPERPFVLLAQQSRFDSSRAPSGKHTAWAYCHVPNGSDFDMAERVETQVERFAPGFRDLILERSLMGPAAMEAHNPNYVGGDIGGGGFGIRKVFQLGSTAPYKIGEGVYLCSSSTPPGAGVHGMCGYYAANAALD